VDASGSVTLRDRVVVDEDVCTSSKIRIEGGKLCVVGRKLKGTAECVVEGDGVVE